MNTTKCRTCDRQPAILTTFRVERIGAEVEHWTCERCTEPLKADMVEAGWTVAGVAGA
jgi:protein-arginine kinase activator protein McsA